MKLKKTAFSPIEFLVIVAVLGLIAVVFFSSIDNFSKSKIITRVSAREIVHQSISSDSVKRIIFDSIKYDEKGEYSTSSGVFTAKELGYYLVYAQIVLDNFPAKSSFSMEIRKNGIAGLEARVYGTNDSAMPHITMAQAQDVLLLNADDTVEITVRQSTGESVVTTGYNYFIIHQLP